MIDLRPVGYVIGLMVMALGLAMFLPMLVDIAEGRGHWPVFAESGILTVLIGGLVASGLPQRGARGADNPANLSSDLQVFG